MREAAITVTMILFTEHLYIIYISIYKNSHSMPQECVDWLLLNYTCSRRILTYMNFLALTSRNVILSCNFSLNLFCMWHVYVLCHIYYVKFILLFVDGLAKSYFKCWDFIMHGFAEFVVSKEICAKLFTR